MWHAAAIATRGFLLLWILALSGCTSEPSSLPVPVGTWQGASVDRVGFPARLEVAADGAKLFTACATGTMPRPLVVDRSGGFAIDGKWAQYGFGGYFELPAHFSGSVAGTTMSLTVTTSASSHVFFVRHGAPETGSWPSC